MLTDFGKVSRKIRIDLDLTLRDLSERLCISAAYISAIETGRRALTKKILEQYLEIIGKNSLRDELYEAGKRAMSTIDIDLDGKSNEKRDIALSFARSFNNLTVEEIAKLKNIFKDRENT